MSYFLPSFFISRKKATVFLFQMKKLNVDFIFYLHCIYCNILTVLTYCEKVVHYLKYDRYTLGFFVCILLLIGNTYGFIRSVSSNSMLRSFFKQLFKNFIFIILSFSTFNNNIQEWFYPQSLAKMWNHFHNEQILDLLHRQ